MPGTVLRNPAGTKSLALVGQKPLGRRGSWGSGPVLWELLGQHRGHPIPLTLWAACVLPAGSHETWKPSLSLGAVSLTTCRRPLSLPHASPKERPLCSSPARVDFGDRNGGAFWEMGLLC